MPERDSALPEVYPVDDADEFHVAMTQGVKQRLYGYLRPEHASRSLEYASHQEGQFEKGVLAHITRSTGDNRVTHIVDSIVPPEKEGDVYMDGRRLKFSAAYRARAKDQIEHDPRKGIAYFHSHPGWSAYPSGPDLDAAEARLQSDADRLGADRPFASGIIATHPRHETGEPEWSFRAYDFEDGDSTATQATAVRVLGAHPFADHRDGPYLKKLPTPFPASGPAGPGNGYASVSQDSTLELWGERGQARLSGIRVAVVGCGGVGSLLAEQVGRLGVGEAVFVDFDHLKEANLNRAYGATPEDARQNQPKAEVARRIAENAATAPGFQARAVQGSIVESEARDFAALGAVLDCDVILNAADPHWVRQVVDRVAYAHLIPVVSGGTLLEVASDTDEITSSARSAVATAGPGLPCLHCQHVWKHGDREDGVVHDRKPLNERDDGDGLYVVHEGGDAADGSDELRDPSVVTTNGFVASLMMERFHALVVGTSTSTFAGKQIYRPKSGEMQWLSEGGSRKTTCDEDCDAVDRVGLGDFAALNTGHDYDLRHEVPDVAEQE
jgi:hypothetical protein